MAGAMVRWVYTLPSHKSPGLNPANTMTFASQLSPGQDHLLVPRDVAGNLDFRLRVLEAAAEDEVFRRGLVELCRQDLLFFVSLFGWQYNPKRPGDEVGPFVTWPAQDECLMWFLEGHETQQDGVVEKSREEGATWLALWVEVWLAAFHEWKLCFNVSRNADAVDKSGNKNSLFAKVDFILEHLPLWLVEVARRVKFLFDFDNGSQIAGEATTEAAGVSGRAGFALIDELAQIDADHEVISFTTDTCNARQFISTHTGVGTAFHLLCQRADAGEVRRFRLHWSVNPTKNRGLYRAGPKGEFTPLDPTYVYPEKFAPVLDGSPTGGLAVGLRSPWYDDQVRRRGGNASRDVKLNLDCDVAGAGRQFYDPLLIDMLARKGSDPLWEGDLFLDGAEGWPLDLIPRKGGTLQLWVEPGNDAQGKLLHVTPARYSVGADASAGTGATPSCATVFNADTGQKVGRYTNAFAGPEKFGEFLVALCRVFRDADGSPAFLAWETPGVGSIVTKTVYHGLGYRNVYKRTQEFNGEVVESDIPGWNSSSTDSRLQLHSLYHSHLRTGTFHNPSAADLKETLAFVHERNSVENPKATRTDDPTAAGLNHSDHVIADALALFGAVKKGWVGEKVAEQRAESEPHPNSIAGRRAYYNRPPGRPGASLWK